MTATHSSGNISGHSVIVPGLSGLIADPAAYDRKTAAAFARADGRGRRVLFAMRGLLGEIFPEGLRSCDSAVDLTEAVERICSIGRADADAGLLLPGLILPPSGIAGGFDGGMLRRLCLCGGDITVHAGRFAEGILGNAAGTGCRVSVMTGRRVGESLMRAVTDAVAAGVAVTLCFAGNVPRLTGGNAVIDRDGRLLRAGEDIAVCTVLNNKGLGYAGIKSGIEAILESEVSRRFYRSKAGEYRHRMDAEDSQLDKWALFYPRCTEAEEVRGITSGGAVRDLVFVELADPEGMEPSHFAMACRALEGYYPIGAVPFMRTRREVASDGGFAHALREAAPIHRGIGGRALLELALCDGYAPTSAERFASAVSGFFGLGGIALRLKLKGERHE